MRIVVDENMADQRLSDSLEAAGHDVILAIDAGLLAATDARVLIWAIAASVAHVPGSTRRKSTRPCAMATVFARITGGTREILTSCRPSLWYLKHVGRACRPGQDTEENQEHF